MTVQNPKRQALTLSLFTVAYNIVEGIVSIIAGLLAGSTALVGFAFDSLIESLSGMVMIWRFKKHGTLSPEEEDESEERAERLVGYTFIILGLYVLFEAGRDLYFRETPDPSSIGIIVAVLSIVIMPLLYLAKMRVARAIDSRSLMADAKETLACAYLSVALLLGLALNYYLGVWWADPAAGAVIAVFLLKEGRETLTEEDED